MSMTEVSRKGQIGKWIGFANWPILLQDEKFLAAVTRSLKFSTYGVVGALLLGVVLALLLNVRGYPHGRRIFSAAWRSSPGCLLQLWQP